MKTIFLYISDQLVKLQDINAGTGYKNLTQGYVKVKSEKLQLFLFLLH